MSCPYYSFQSALFGGDYYCNVVQRVVDDDTYHKYCKGYNYDSCPNYKRQHTSSGGCYLTTACIYAKCLPDNCYELETLRNYRDSWLKQREGGKEIIEEYYTIAPKIVEKVNEREDKKEIYNMLYDEMVVPCVKLIEQKRYEETMDLYRTMTLSLKKKYW